MENIVIMVEAICVTAIVISFFYFVSKGGD